MNLKAKVVSSIGLLGLLCLMLPKAARADDFTFSFTNTVGGVSGTITGEIFGLSNNGIAGAATDVTITSFPAAFNGDPSLTPPPAPTDIFAAPWTIGNNSFTESGGSISAYLFTAHSDAGLLPTNLQLVSTIPPGGEFDFHPPFATQAIVLSGPVTFAPVAAPEPSSISLMLIGLVALGTLAAVSKRKPLGQSLVN